MAIIETKRACEKHLSVIVSPSITAYESVAFRPTEALYYRIQFKNGRPTDPVFGRGYYRENIQCQIFVCDKLDEGTLNSIQKAELIRDHFKKGTTFTEGATMIHILRTPQIAGSIRAEDRLVTPVLIDLSVEIYDY